MHYIVKSMLGDVQVAWGWHLLRSVSDLQQYRITGAI